MKVLEIVAAAAIALAPFSVIATIPVVAHANPVPDDGTDPKDCQRFPVLLAQYRIPKWPALPGPGDDCNSGADPTGPSTKSPSPERDPGRPADEEPAPPRWHSVVLQYGVLMTAVGLAAWRLGLSSRRTIGTPPVPSRSRPRSAGPGALAVKPPLANPFSTIRHPSPEG